MYLVNIHILFNKFKINNVFILNSDLSKTSSFIYQQAIFKLQIFYAQPIQKYYFPILLQS